jgi:hypothetical protein
MGPTSLTLLDRLQQQQRPEDWTRFVELYEPFIRRFIRMDAKLAADADDVCQEVMRKIVSHLRHFERNREGSQSSDVGSTNAAQNRIEYLTAFRRLSSPAVLLPVVTCLICLVWSLLR